jgi:hypothetical protein
MLRRLLPACCLGVAACGTADTTTAATGSLQLNFEVADRRFKFVYPVAVRAADLHWPDGLSVQDERQ